MEPTLIFWAVGLYLFIMLITAGHFYRCGEIGRREALAILGAPFWWIIAKGVRGTLRTMGRVVYDNHILWAVGFIAVGHFLALAQRCSTLSSCSVQGIEAAFLSLPPVAFVYWGYVWGAG